MYSTGSCCLDSLDPKKALADRASSNKTQHIFGQVAAGQGEMRGVKRAAGTPFASSSENSCAVWQASSYLGSASLPWTRGSFDGHDVNSPRKFPGCCIMKDYVAGATQTGVEESFDKGAYE